MIKTVGEMNNVLNSYNASDWIKSNETKQDSNTTNKTFGEFLFESVAKVNDLQKEANFAVEKLATGNSTNLHETMLMVEQAELAFKTMNQLRMKVLDVYKEIMKVQI